MCVTNQGGGAPQGGGGAKGQSPPELPKRGALPPQLSHYHVMYTITYSHIIGLFIKNYS